MIRNSIIYRRIWYIKRRNSKKLYVYFRLLSIVIIFVFVVFYAINYSIPYINSNIEQMINSSIQAEVQSAVTEILDMDESLKASDSNGEVAGQFSSVSNNVAKLDELTRELSDRLKYKLDEINNQGIRIPMGAVFGDTVLANIGPKLCFKSRLIDDIDLNAKSSMSNLDDDIYQLNGYINVNCKVGIKILFDEGILDVNTKVPIVDRELQND